MGEAQERIDALTRQAILAGATPEHAREAATSVVERDVVVGQEARDRLQDIATLAKDLGFEGITYDQQQCALVVSDEAVERLLYSVAYSRGWITSND